MRKRRGNLIIPKWSRNLGYMLANSLRVDPETPPIEVYVGCSRCQTRDRLTPTKLAELLLEKGPLYSLWNRRPKCRTCGGERYYSGSSGGPGAIVFPLATDADNVSVVSIHEAWRQERQRERTKG